MYQKYISAKPPEMPYTKQFAIIQPFVQYCTKIQPDIKKVQPDIKKNTAGFEKKVQPDLKSGCCHTHFFDALVHVHKNQSLIV